MPPRRCSGSFFLTALALAPTAEKDLTDIQRSLFAARRCPSAFALPPVQPLFSGRREPGRELLAAIRKQGWPCFRFQAYALRGTILCARPHPEGPAADFYLADLQTTEPPDANSLPALPAGAIKTLRLIVMEITPQGEASIPAAPWRRGLRWRILHEDWIKLMTNPAAERGIVVRIK
ncbi:MAG: hypothetical protein LBQ57_09740 [Spirochaetales bacterium]|nr:hypothetical protein [Spirochaetales bacterium]